MASSFNGVVDRTFDDVVARTLDAVARTFDDIITRTLHD